MATTPATHIPSEELLEHDHNEDDRSLAPLALGLILAFQFPEPGQLEHPGTTALPQLIGAASLLLGVLVAAAHRAHDSRSGAQ